jgi:Cohesin domain
MTRTLLAALAMAAIVILQPLRVAADPVLSAPFVTVGVGDTFTIPISITGSTDVTSWQFDLVYSPSLVKANSVTEGPFMSAFGTTSFTPGVIDNVTGLISLVADSYVDLPPDPSGDGVLANIEFTALAPGVSPLTFSNVFLNFSNEEFSITNGQITVTGTARVPEAATLALLTSGLALLIVRRLTRRGRSNDV